MGLWVEGSLYIVLGVLFAELVSRFYERIKKRRQRRCIRLLDS